MSYELVKFITPLIGVGLGIFIAPYIDHKKAKRESKHAIDCFYTELEDYFEDSSKFVKNFHDCFMKSKKVEMGLITEDDKLLPISFYPKIDFLTIERVIEKSFLDLTKDQRKAVKALKLLAYQINENTEQLCQLRTITEYKSNKLNFFSATSTSSAFYYLLSRLTIERERFKYFQLSNDQVRQNVMDSLGISFDDSVFGNTHNKRLKRS